MNRQSNERQQGERQPNPAGDTWRRWIAWFRVLDLRDRWWRLLDLLETRRALRWTLYGLLAAGVAFGALRVWVYPWWVERNAIGMARQWIDAGQLGFAADAVRNAVLTAPENPRTWQLAAELARLGGRNAEAVVHARHAAALDPKNPEYVLGWASAALQADMQDEADRALATVSQEYTSHSAYAQRLIGELARRRGDLTPAKNRFEAALQLDGPMAIDEVPLGLILLNARDPAERQRGLNLLAKWSTNQEWGATALRTLLADAMARDERPAMLRWAETLRAHPRCTLGDVPNCLAAISKADGGHFAEVLAILEKNYAVAPQASAQLVGWLNQIGRGEDAVIWMKTLPQEGLKHPPLAVVGAEALRQTAAWIELRDLTQRGDWGNDLEFLRWAYGMRAARALGDQAKAEEFWRSLRAHATTNSVHALFAGDTIFTWGLTKEAEILWWAAADQGGPNAIQSLGTLARYYQTKHDDEGQYRAFRQLYFAHPQDANVSNNFVYFAALTRHDGPTVDRLAKANHAADPDNLTYLATRAFVLFMDGRAADALALLKPKAAEVQRSPALAFAYGLALSGAGYKTEARALLGKFDPGSQSALEIELVKSALAD